MKHINKIQKLIFKICNNNNTLITYKDCLKYHINFIYFKRLNKQNKLYKLANDVYSSDPYTLLDEMWYIQYKNRNFIFDRISSLSSLNMTQFIPYKYDIATFKNNKFKNINKFNVVYSNKNILDLGMITITNDFGNKIKIYCPERVIANIIKNNEYSEFAEKAIKEFNNYSNKNIKKFIAICKHLKITNNQINKRGVII